MQRLLLLILAIGGLSAAALVSRARPTTPADPNSTEAKFVVESEAKNPWTGLTPNTDPGQFQFVVVSDRTGGHRKGVFSRAVHQVNLLQPEFVMSVGDLIEGSAGVADTNRTQWDEFDKYARQFASWLPAQ
jgi:serine/threonine-protein phosphatase CPPED1